MATLAGIGSGLDLESIISTFVKAEKGPKVERLNEKELSINDIAHEILVMAKCS